MFHNALGVAYSASAPVVSRAMQMKWPTTAEIPVTSYIPDSVSRDVAHFARSDSPLEGEAADISDQEWLLDD